MNYKKTIVRSIRVNRTPRCEQMLGMFDVPPSDVSEQSWEVNFDLPDQWNVGVIVGPSGCGKSTIARELFGSSMVEKWPWSTDECVIDGFPKSMPIKDVTALLSSVGFSTPPAWVRPFHALSNGQQFRVNLARTLAEMPALAVVDEFTSVVDRQVAKLGSAAVAKTVRRRKQKFIAVSCHYDVIEWLEPDWVFEPATNQLTLSREGLWRRPKIEMEIIRTNSASWQIFKSHHYLTASLRRGAICFVAMIDKTPAAFSSVTNFPHPISPGWREHRTVCLPDFQGVGIGTALSDYVASLMVATGRQYTSTTGHPGLIKSRFHSPKWKMLRKPGMASVPSNRNHAKGSSAGRLTASFKFVGLPNLEDARAFGLLN